MAIGGELGFGLGVLVLVLVLSVDFVRGRSWLWVAVAVGGAGPDCVFERELSLVLVETRGSRSKGPDGTVSSSAAMSGSVDNWTRDAFFSAGGVKMEEIFDSDALISPNARLFETCPVSTALSLRSSKSLPEEVCAAIGMDIPIIAC